MSHPIHLFRASTRPTRSLIESAMSGPGSVDDMAAQPFQAPGRPYRAAYMAPAVTAPWLPGASVLENGLNCSFDSGASYAPRDLAKPVSLPECFQRCQAGRRCDAVRAAWWAVQRNWSARQVGCRLRGGVNLPACTIQKGSNSANVRCSTFAADAPAKSQLAVAVSALAGYRTEPQHLWSVAPQPGDSGGTLPALLTAVRSEPALGLAAIRLSAPAASAAHFAILRYDALGSGRAALAVVNLAGAGGPVELDLSRLPPQLLGQRPATLGCGSPPCILVKPLSPRYAVEVDGRGFPRLQGSGSRDGPRKATSSTAPRPPLRRHSLE